jgi:hypothetical protein
MITDYKASPIDEGADKFLKLFKERIVLWKVLFGIKTIGLKGLNS